MPTTHLPPKAKRESILTISCYKYRPETEHPTSQHPGRQTLTVRIVPISCSVNRVWFLPFPFGFLNSSLCWLTRPHSPGVCSTRRNRHTSPQDSLADPRRPSGTSGNLVLSAYNNEYIRNSRFQEGGTTAMAAAQRGMRFRRGLWPDYPYSEC